MLEEGAAELGEAGFVEGRQIDAVDVGAERAGHRAEPELPIGLMFCHGPEYSPAGRRRGSEGPSQRRSDSPLPPSTPYISFIFPEA
ncbi:hypothetical protein FRZ61_31080 [Hypericibacter adhaerens]|uniref:Uncharacterized protein n=1 Tax=Hypericibacter adhaerens TaxID=2602016 RepID=A0A5J6N2K3_9PROT|nr:hypothetical protein FRZ61_31080 [Hypericibacter adhaerens]